MSAYLFPFRVQPVPSSATRAEEFVRGARLVDAVALHDFDSRLRGVLLSGLQELEVTLRALVAYRIGAHGPLAHLDRSGLDPRRCREPNRGPDHRGTRYEAWRREYDSLQRKARREDFVEHFTSKYGGDVPVWAATEFMTFGSLVYLFKLMQPQDARRVSNSFGVRSQDVLHGWLKALNVERNHCAHNARIWNRRTTYSPDRINTSMVGFELHHLVDAKNDRPYFLAAVLSYLLTRTNPGTKFPLRFSRAVATLPDVNVFDPHAAMGLTPNWERERLWLEN